MSSQRTKQYQDSDTLERLYWQEGLSTPKIADELDCCQRTVCEWMDRYNIPRRDQVKATREASRVEYATHLFTESREEWQDSLGERVGIHQLLAIAEGADPYEVFDPDIVSHHSTHHPLDNRPGVIEVMSRSEHVAYHNQQDIPQWKKELMNQIERPSSAASTKW